MQRRKSPVFRVLTNSERSSLACPRRWAFKYLDGLTTSDNPAPLRMGSLWHLVLATFYRSLTIPGYTPGNPVDLVKSSVIAPWLEARAEYRRTVEDPARRDELAREDDDHAALCEAMFRGYVDTWGGHDADNWEIVAVEAQGARAITRPDGSPLRDMVNANGKRIRREWVYGGGMDLLIRNRHDGRVWLVEHKTTSESNLDNYLRKLNFDPQIRGYGWILANPASCSDLAVTVLGPTRIAGVIYNVARKRVPGVPSLLKDGKRLSKAAIDTTRDVFMSEVIRHGFNPDDYADVLDGLRGKVYFAREAYPFTDPEIAAFGDDVRHFADAVMVEQRRGHHLRQVSVCTGPAAMPCPFQSSVCLEDGPMARRAFTVMGIRHPELTGAMAEPNAATERRLVTSSNFTTPVVESLTKTAPGGNTEADPFAI